MNKAEIVVQAFANRQQIQPFTDTDAAFDLPSAYSVQREVTARHVAQGARVIGVKVGFTNTNIWEQYGIHAPIHAPVLDTSLASGEVDIAPLMEPLIEPEVIFKLGATPKPHMDDAALLACVDAAAPGFEIVHSAFPGWRCKAPDSVAAVGMHARLVVGEWVPVDQHWMQALATFTTTVSCDGAVKDRGKAGNLLGSGPLAVLRHLIGLDSADPLRKGDLVSTGTVTQALPIRSGQNWEARFEGLPFAPVSVRLI